MAGWVNTTLTRVTITPSDCMCALLNETLLAGWLAGWVRCSTPELEVSDLREQDTHGAQLERHPCQVRRIRAQRHTFPLPAPAFASDV